MGVENWSTTAADNDDADIANGVDWREGMAPGQVDGSARSMMAALKTWYNQVGGNLPFQCVLSYVSTTSVRLDAKDGSWIFINGAVYQIPSTGPTLSNTSLSASTLYYVYAYVSGATITLEASTTGYTTDAIYRHKVKSGDGSRTLVGMIRTNSSSQFFDAASGIGVASYYNRRLRRTVQDLSNQTSASTSVVYLSTTNGMLCWSDEAVQHLVTGSAFNDSAASCSCVAALDGSPKGLESKGYSAVSNASTAVSAGFADTVSEGYHTFGAGVYVTAGTGRWDITLSTLTRC